MTLIIKNFKRLVKNEKKQKEEKEKELGENTIQSKMLQLWKEREH